MDATLSLGLPRLNQSGTLLEGIALWGELKPLLTHEAVAERALRYCDLAVAQGLLAVRSHVDVCDDRLLAVEALLDVKRRVEALSRPATRRLSAGRLFPLAERAPRNLERALDLGVDVVGGIPHFERTMADGAASVTALCEIAAKRGLHDRPALRRERRSAVAPRRDARVRGAAARARRARDRLASDLDAFDGQLLRLEAAAADRRSRASTRSPIRSSTSRCRAARYVSAPARPDPHPGTARAGRRRSRSARIA